MKQRRKKPTPKEAILARVHRSAAPIRKHFLPEWAERRGLDQVDFVENLGADKGTVSRWFAGVVPTDDYLVRIASYMSWDDPRMIFQHPDEDWIKRLFQGRSEDERKRMLDTLETAFPKRASN